jgi:hypothetical protein
VTAPTLVTGPDSGATMSPPRAAPQASAAQPSAVHPVPDLALLESVQRGILWLGVRMIDAANRERDTADGVKVGGHMASSASLVSAMTALWMAHLDAPDRVAVKDQAHQEHQQQRASSATGTGTGDLLERKYPTSPPRQ